MCKRLISASNMMYDLAVFNLYGAPHNFKEWAADLTKQAVRIKLDHTVLALLRWVCRKVFPVLQETIAIAAHQSNKAKPLQNMMFTFSKHDMNGACLYKTHKAGESWAVAKMALIGSFCIMYWAVASDC